MCPDGYDEWGWVNKDSMYHNIMDRYYEENPTYNGEWDGSVEKRVRTAIYGDEEYKFNGGA